MAGLDHLPGEVDIGPFRRAVEGIGEGEADVEAAQARKTSRRYQAVAVGKVGCSASVTKVMRDVMATGWPDFGRTGPLTSATAGSAKAARPVALTPTLIRGLCNFSGLWS